MAPTTTAPRRKNRSPETALAAVDGQAPPAELSEKAKATTPIEQIPIWDIAAWSENPRKFRDDKRFTELVEQVRQNGILQNIVVRPNPFGPEKYLLVAGERRWRAANLVGLRTIPAAIRDLSDEAAYELALIENLGREDMSPMDEAIGYQRMMVEWSHTAEDVAGKVGKPLGYIKQRLVLCNLVPEAMEMFRADRFTIGGAIELARVDKAMQKHFLSSLESGGVHVDDGATLNTALMRRILREEFLDLQEIEDAPFDPSDVTLNPEMGACSACPFNTLTQRELFDEESKGKGQCLNKTCWTKKADVAYLRMKEKTEQSGGLVLEGKEAEKVCQPHWDDIRRESGLVSLKDTVRLPGMSAAAQDDDGDDDAPAAGKPAEKSFEELLVPVLEQHPEAITLVKHPTREGVFHRCVRSDKLPELLKEAGEDRMAKSIARGRVATSVMKPDPMQDPRHRHHLAEIKSRREAIAKIGDYIADKLRITTDVSREKQVRALIVQIVTMKWTRNNSDAAKRRGFGDKSANAGRMGIGTIKPDKRLDGMSLPHLIAFLLELLLEVEGAYNTSAHLKAIFDVAPFDYKELSANNLKTITDKAKQKAKDKKDKEKKAGGKAKKGAK